MTSPAQDDAGADAPRRPRMLFLRDYRRFTGGHLKYLHHLGHVAAHGRFRPLIHITSASRLDELERLLPPGIEQVALPTACEAVFVAGTDWDILDAAGQDTARTPVINLIQHVRHSDPDHPLYRFLTRPALRICVSAQVASALAATGKVNGPIEVIENGIELAHLRSLRRDARPTRLLIAGLKAPDLAAAVAIALTERGIGHDLLGHHLPRAEFLARLAAAEHAILLPNETEGFYLPALEAMALGTTVITPDCVGARGFAIDDETCVIAARDAQSLADAAAALIADPARAARLRQGGDTIARRHSLAAERRAAFALLDRFEI